MLLNNRSKPRHLIFIFIAFLTVQANAQFNVVDASATATLKAYLKQYAFTGMVGQSLTKRLGRPINQPLANLGRLLFFDQISSLHKDNSCSGCHSPTNAFGDTQSVSIGIVNNGMVGPSRQGPRNQRRAPSLLNAAFYPKLMWNGRFSSVSGDPFNTSAGFLFPPPEGTTYFMPSDPRIYHLLVAQGHMPPTEMTEVAGFTGTAGTVAPLFDQFDDGLGLLVPPVDSSGSHNQPIRDQVLIQLNNSDAYKRLFGAVFPEVSQGAPIEFYMFGQAIAEFEFTLTYANAPIDQFARGNTTAMSTVAKQGANLFFGTARCVQCHAVSGQSNEMFSDFQNRSIAAPQVAPNFGTGLGDVLFDGSAANEDFGAEQISGDSSDRYHFRTAPLRNLVLQPAYFHDGSFTKLEDAVLHHLDAINSLQTYNPVIAGLPQDLTLVSPPRIPLIASIDPQLLPVQLSATQFNQLIAFLKVGLLDPNAVGFCNLIPPSLPSGARLPVFEGCAK